MGILYDRTAGGEYFHVYSSSFADRFFFEIVQRTDGYDAYGALNAPARMASQAQARRAGDPGVGRVEASRSWMNGTRRCVSYALAKNVNACKQQRDAS